MFEPIHGSAPPLAGTDSANPLATLLAVAEMLRWLRQAQRGPGVDVGGRCHRISVAEIVENGAPLTSDIVGADEGASLTVVAAEVTERVAASARVTVRIAPAAELGDDCGARAALETLCALPLALFVPYPSF